jgi:Phosphotransferase enzyme family
VANSINRQEVLDSLLECNGQPGYIPISWLPVITLEAMETSTGEDAASEFMTSEILRGSDWRLVGVARKYVRLEPPNAYWAMYQVVVERGSEQRELRMVYRGVFSSEFWPRYRDGLLNTVAANCDPLNGLGNAVIDDVHQTGIWFYPVDPQLPSLARAADPGIVRDVVNRNCDLILGQQQPAAELRIHLERYLPEISATLRYEIAAGNRVHNVFAKVGHGDADIGADALQQQLWSASMDSEGMLQVARPLGHYPAIGASLQQAASGKPVSPDRTAPRFQASALVAAEALAAIHSYPLATDVQLDIEDELWRLEQLQDQLALVHPRGYQLLAGLRNQLHARLEIMPEEERRATHGDLKYDQFIDDGRRFTLIDFEYFGVAETSWDLAKYCAHVVPSMPLDWQQSAAAEAARAGFLERYLAIRPEATIQRFPIYEAVQLAQRVMVMMWGQRRGWRDAAESLLVLAGERLVTPPP